MIQSRIDSNSDILLQIAKDSIKNKLFGTESINKDLLLQEYPELSQQRATFVTLNLNNRLRGCIGSLIPQRSLLEDIISNAASAAFSDPRFFPLSSDEFENIDIEISLLTIPAELPYKDTDDLKSKLRTGIDGVILKSGFNQATFLPQVWEQLPTFELFFEHLCQKAGLSGNCLGSHPEILIYQADKIK